MLQRDQIIFAFFLGVIALAVLYGVQQSEPADPKLAKREPSRSPPPVRIPILSTDRTP